MIVLLALLALISFSYNIYLTEIAPAARFSLDPLPHLWGGATNQNAAFYFLLPRAWELLLGGLLALTAFSVKENISARLLSWLGVILLGIGIFGIDHDTPFPGLASLFPVMGTVLLIAAHGTKQTPIYRVLSAPPLVGIGLISYSLYLWHWPLLVLAKQHIGGELTFTAIVCLLLTSFALAYLTYRFIETPFRQKRFLRSKVSVYLAGVLSLLIVGALGYTIHTHNGAPYRAPEATRAIGASATDDNPRVYECFKRSVTDVGHTKEPCVIGERTSTSSASFILWGDSHANAIMPAFDAVAEMTDKTGIFFARGGCAPLLVKEGTLSKDTDCNTLKRDVLAYVRENDIETIYIVSAWKDNYSNHTTGEQVAFTEALDYTISLFGEETGVTLVHRVPEQINFDTRDAFLSAVRDSLDLNELSISKEAFLEDQSYIRGVINERSIRGDIFSIDPSLVLCNGVICPLSVSGKILYRDTDHISTTGALELQHLITL